jgi:hypothetical protein
MNESNVVNLTKKSSSIDVFLSFHPKTLCDFYNNEHQNKTKHSVYIYTSHVNC